MVEIVPEARKQNKLQRRHVRYVPRSVVIAAAGGDFLQKQKCTHTHTHVHDSSNTKYHRATILSF